MQVYLLPTVTVQHSQLSSCFEIAVPYYRFSSSVESSVMKTSLGEVVSCGSLLRTFRQSFRSRICTRWEDAFLIAANIFTIITDY